MKEDLIKSIARLKHHAAKFGDIEYAATEYASICHTAKNVTNNIGPDLNLLKKVLSCGQELLSIFKQYVYDGISFWTHQNNLRLKITCSLSNLDSFFNQTKVSVRQSRQSVNNGYIWNRPTNVVRVSMGEEDDPWRMDPYLSFSSDYLQLIRSSSFQMGQFYREYQASYHD